MSPAVPNKLNSLKEAFGEEEVGKREPRSTGSRREEKGRAEYSKLTSQVYEFPFLEGQVGARVRASVFRRGEGFFSPVTKLLGDAQRELGS